MEDKSLEEIFINSYSQTTKKFPEVFKIEQSKMGIQLTTLIPVKIKDLELNQSKTIFNEDLKINNVSIFDLQNSILIGTINKNNNMFIISGYKDDKSDFFDMNQI